MFRFPFFGYPYGYPYYQYYNKHTNYKPTIERSKKENSITNKEEISNTINTRSSNSNEQAIFELLGIKLYFDDLIILGLLYFLYQENVKDEMLYIILFLLLF